MTAADRCVYCAGGLAADAGELACGACGQRYPIIAGIPVLALRPAALVAAHHQSLVEARAGLVHQRARAAALTGGLAERAERRLHGLEQNHALLARYLAPVAEYLRSAGEPALEFIDRFAVEEGGASGGAMLPYFYQDWGGTAEFSSVQSLITGALARHGGDTAAILGAGACGVAHACARSRRVTYAVDLSIPTLLIARGVLGGDALTVHLEAAGWQPVALTPPVPANGELHLVAADVSALPFADGSLSAVVTQYLMDIVGDPLGVAAEIRRVLAPGGVWINFSIPFKVPGEPPELGAPGLDELPGILGPCGFAIVERERRRFTLINVDALDDAVARRQHEVHFFVARAAGAAPVPAARGPSDAAWWQRVPRVAPGHDVQIIRRQVFEATGRSERVEVGSAQLGFPAAPDVLFFIEALFSQLDGRSTRALYDALAAAGIPFEERAFYELVRMLAERHGVLRLS